MNGLLSAMEFLAIPSVLTQQEADVRQIRFVLDPLVPGQGITLKQAAFKTPC